METTKTRVSSVACSGRGPFIIFAPFASRWTLISDPLDRRILSVKTLTRQTTMSGQPKTAIVTGASQGIGAGIVKGFVERGFNVVANSQKVTRSTEVAASDQVALVDGHIGEQGTAAGIVRAAPQRL